MADNTAKAHAEAANGIAKESMDASVEAQKALARARKMVANARENAQGLTKNQIQQLLYADEKLRAAQQTAQVERPAQAKYREAPNRSLYIVHKDPIISEPPLRPVGGQKHPGIPIQNLDEEITSLRSDLERVRANVDSTENSGLQGTIAQMEDMLVTLSGHRARSLPDRAALQTEIERLRGAIRRLEVSDFGKQPEIGSPSLRYWIPPKGWRPPVLPNGSLTYDLPREKPKPHIKGQIRELAMTSSAQALGTRKAHIRAPWNRDAGGLSVPSPAPALDIDMGMPYGDLEPFGREDTAQELTEASIRESDAMVDTIERAEVAEEKRAVFRALTRLRGAAIASFDGVARSQTGNIDEYSKTHQWRETHPLSHLAQAEADVSKWAFPDNADF